VTTRPSRNYTLTRGTTTWPSWNYVLAVRHHHDTRVELRPYVEAPPGTPLKRVHGITSNRWGATKRSHYKSHGITPYPHFIHVPPTKSGSSHNTNIMYKQQIIQLMFSNSYPIRWHTISITSRQDITNLNK